MSMRYAEISGPTDLAPAVPSVPAALRPGFRTQERGTDVEAVQVSLPTKEELREAENKLLDDEKFDSDACTSCRYLALVSAHRN